MMMSVQPTDIAIILVSLAACVYCFVLSRRLRALQNTKDGLGATIMALSKSSSAVSATTQDTRVKAGELAARLSQLLADADAMCGKLNALKGEMTAQQASALEEMEAGHAKLRAAQSDISGSLRDILEESKDRILDLKIQMRQMQALIDAAASMAPEDFTDTPAPNDDTKSRYRYEY